MRACMPGRTQSRPPMSDVAYVRDIIIALQIELLEQTIFDNGHPNLSVRRHVDQVSFASMLSSPEARILRQEMLNLRIRHVSDPLSRTVPGLHYRATRPHPCNCLNTMIQTPDSF